MGDGKVIMIKTDDSFPRLVPATAMQFDSRTQTVELKQIIAVGPGTATNVVPIDRCYEFDDRLMNQVNALTESAVNNLSASQLLCDSGLLQAEFVVDGTNGSLVTH